MMRNSLVISGMFRSGTTLIWRYLSADPNYKTYFCEPLHSNLIYEIKNHKHYSYFKEYPEAINNYSDNFWIKNYRLFNNEKDNHLYKYLSELMFPGSLIKFTRMNLRLNWLLTNFPETKIINVVRDPRAVAYSYLKQARPNNTLTRIRKFLYKKNIISFPINGNFNFTYWSDDYYRYFKNNSFLSSDLEKVKKDDISLIFYLWKVNVIYSIKDLEKYSTDQVFHIGYETFIQNPLKVLKTIYKSFSFDFPEELEKEAKKETVSNLGGTKKWQKELNQNYSTEWKKIDNKIWNNMIEKFDLIDIMNKFNMI